MDKFLYGILVGVAAFVVLSHQYPEYTHPYEVAQSQCVSYATNRGE